jgi:CHAD domain-containing protein
MIGSRQPRHPKKPAFHLKSSESVGKGFSRAITEQLRSASEQLRAAPEQLDESVHEARKSLKKGRSLLRLMKPALGDGFWALNIELRDLGRRLSELRDTQALADMLEQFKESASDTGVRQLLADTRTRLLERKQQIVRDFEAREEISDIANQLNDASQRMSKNLLPEATPEAVAAAIARTARRGRKAFEVAEQSTRAEDFHECRKRAKDLRYQLSFLENLWPHVLEGYSESARELEQCLGEDHNVSVLRDMLSQNNPRKPDLESLIGLLDHEQARFRKQAARLGRLLYAEKPKEWARRIETCLGER